MTPTAVEQVGIIAAKGGTLADITAGDCLELIEIRDACYRTGYGKGNSFYQLLHTMGLMPAGAPATLRMLDPRFQGQLTTAELIGQYDLACAPVRDLLTGYLDERQPGVDYATLAAAFLLGKLFWKDLETHNPGISSLRLAPDAAIAWKRRLSVKVTRAADGEAPGPRERGCGRLPDRCPRRSTSTSPSGPRKTRPAGRSGQRPRRSAGTTQPGRKTVSRRKSRMDQRTRERIPVLPALIAAADRSRKDTAARLTAAAAAAPGDLFTVGGVTLRKTVLTSTEGRANGRAWAEEPVTGTRRDLTREESTAFWTWAAVEVLRSTGIRIEELTELSHHSLVQYRLPSTGELIPLLHIAPSKTDVERLLVISPELADVLAAVIARVRDSTGTVPLVVAYDVHECEFYPAHARAIPAPRRRRQPPARRRDDPQVDHCRAGSHRHHRRLRPAARLQAPRFPKDSLCLVTVLRLAPEPFTSCDFRLRRAVSCFYRPVRDHELLFVPGLGVLGHREPAAHPRADAGPGR